MFNIFGGSGGSNGQITESSIRQANEQMNRMHQRIIELEQRAAEQNELLERRQEEHAIRYHQLETTQDRELDGIKQELWNFEQKFAKMDAMIKERDVQIAFLLHRCSYLDEAASYAPLLDQLSGTLKSAFSAPSPKVVQQVKPNVVVTSTASSNNSNNNNNNNNFATVQKPQLVNNVQSPQLQQQQQHQQQQPQQQHQQQHQQHKQQQQQQQHPQQQQQQQQQQQRQQQHGYTTAPSVVVQNNQVSTKQLPNNNNTVQYMVPKPRAPFGIK